jgi:hypothetical protein
MADGSVGLVVDIAALIERSTSTGSQASRPIALVA